MLEMHMPLLFTHLAQQGVEPTMYASQWFMTVCIYGFRFRTVCRVWDIFLAEGVKIIFRVALAILKLNEKEILNAGFEEILNLLKQAPATLESDLVIQTALSIKLKDTLLKELEAEFLNSGSSSSSDS